MRTVLLLPLAAATATPCAVGLTLLGLGADLDGDFIATAFDEKGASMYSKAHADPKGDKRQLQLTKGCILCNATQAALAKDTWVIWSDDNAPGQAGKYSLLAVCASGCPNATYWPTDLHVDATWQVLTELEDREVLGASPLKVSMGCCARKAQKCDGCENAKCHEHKTFAGCLAASAVSCCQAWGWIDAGACLCKSAPLECDHGTSPPALELV